MLTTPPESGKPKTCNKQLAFCSQLTVVRMLARSESCKRLESSSLRGRTVAMIAKWLLEKNLHKKIESKLFKANYLKRTFSKKQSF